MKILAAILGVVVLLAGVIAYNVWRANREPITSAPGAVDVGRQKLHAQLDQTKKNEAQLEKQNWNSIPQLRILVQDHQQRIDKLANNKEAAEIVAYDRDTIARLQKRITELEALPPPEQPDQQTAPEADQSKPAVPRPPASSTAHPVAKPE